MLAVLSLELLVLIGTVHATRLSSSLNNNAEQILAKQVENCSGYIEQFMMSAQDLTSISNYVNSEMEDFIESGEIDIDTLDSSSENCVEFMQTISEELISFMRTKPVTGAFVILNTHDLDEREDGSSLPGIYLRDLDPDAQKSELNEDLSYMVAPPKVVQSMRIYTDQSWQPAVRYYSQPDEFIYRPFQTAYSDDERLSQRDYGYWTTKPFVLPNDTKRIITYSEPLILSDGTVYGVIGVELLESYVIKKLSATELQNDDSGVYALAYSDASDSSGEMNAIICSSDEGKDELIFDKISLGGKSEGSLKINGEKCYASSVPLGLYSRNTPFFNERWQVIAVVPEERLYEMSDRVNRMLFVIIAVTFAVGLFGSLSVGRQLSYPIKILSHEVDAAQSDSEKMPVLSRTGISELDSFSEAYTKMSQGILDTSTKFLRIMNMASYELGGYEIRPENQHVYVTDNFFSMLGIDAPKILTAEEFKKIMIDFSAGTPNVCKSDGDVVYKIENPNGGTRYIRLCVTTEKAFQVGMLEDVTAQTVERKRIEHERDYDNLTGLFNRDAFKNRCLSLLENNKDLGYGAFLMMDVDNLKRINDKYGHSWGDRYISLAGKFLSENLPENSLSARQSGDEFVAFLYGYPGYNELQKKLMGLSKISHNYKLNLPDGKVLPISISCGVSWYPSDTRDLKTLQKYADFAMYQVKKATKGVIGTFDVSAYNHERFEEQLRREFYEVLEKQKLFYFFQPLFSSKTGEAEAYEALMRVDMPMLKTPIEVLHLAKKLNRLYDIEYLTMFKATATFMKLRENGEINSDAKLFINSISNIVLSESDWEKYESTYPSDVIDSLVVEILESEELDYHTLEIKREFLKKYSGDFALDDYGVGYSNSYTLLELSPRYIKVDMSIIRGINSDANKREIVRGIVEYAHQRNMKIVAEGVENSDELRCVISLGVDLLQGYYLAKPSMPPAAISEEALKIILESEKQEVFE